MVVHGPLNAKDAKVAKGFKRKPENLCFSASQLSNVYFSHTQSFCASLQRYATFEVKGGIGVLFLNLEIHFAQK